MLTLYIIITLLLSAIVQTTIQTISWFVFYRLVKYWEKERRSDMREEGTEKNANN